MKKKIYILIGDIIYFLRTIKNFDLYCFIFIIRVDLKKKENIFQLLNKKNASNLKHEYRLGE